MKRKLIRWVGAYFLKDGLFTLFFGRKYVRLFRFGRAGARLSPASASSLTRYSLAFAIEKH